MKEMAAYPGPQPPPVTAKEYLQALAQNRLLGLKCQKCGYITAPPRLVCRHCSSRDVVVIELSGRGQIVSFTSVYIPADTYTGPLPYLVVMVELAEGPWILGNLCGADPAGTSIEIIGHPVKMDNSLLSPTPGKAIAPLFVLE
jgi:uncharacterized protein